MFRGYSMIPFPTEAKFPDVPPFISSIFCCILPRLFSTSQTVFQTVATFAAILLIFMRKHANFVQSF